MSDYEPYQWQVGDPADWGGSVGVPDIPYMGYLNGDDDEDEFPTPPRKTTSESLHDEAWRLRNQGRYEEALDLINEALQHDDRDFDNWNVKAIILEDMHKYELAIECYDEALRLNPNARNVKNNKAYSLSRLAEIQKYTDHDWQKALEFINDALKLVSDDDGRKYTYLHIKGNILGELGRKVDAWACYLLADKMYDRLDELEGQRKIIESSKDTLINITGTYFYKEASPLLKGVVVDLVKESENIHDRDAIRVERNGETVGYVANSPYTLVDGVKSATQIKDIVDDDQKAEIMFRYAQDYIIAKLI